MSLLQDGFHWFLLTLDAAIYWLIGYAYRIFMLLSRIRLFQDDTIEAFANRIYVIIGVIMLFVVSYAILKQIVNPDSGKQSSSKVVTNILKALVLVTIMPEIFNFAYTVQNAVIDNNILGKIILGGNNEIRDGESFTGSHLNNGGNVIGINVFKVFFYPRIQENDTSEGGFIANVTPVVYGPNQYDYNQAMEYIEETGDFYVLAKFNTSVTKGEVTYRYIISSIVGIYVLYLLVSYCLDLAIRLVKLSFYQLMAPIPILSIVIPGQENLFKSWTSQTISTFVQVFIRLITIFFAIFMITVVVENAPLWQKSNMFGGYNLTLLETMLITGFIIIGILTFMRQAPKLISDLFGFKDTGGGSIREKLAAGGVFTALGLGASAGSGAVAGVKNAVHGVQTGKKWYQTAGSAIGGATSTTFRGSRRAFVAKSIGDVKTGASESLRTTEERRNAREEYRAQHGGTLMGSMAGHVGDAVRGATGMRTREQVRLAELDSISKVQNLANTQIDTAKSYVENHAGNYRDSSGQTLADINGQIQQLENVDISTLSSSDAEKYRAALDMHRKNKEILIDHYATERINGIASGKIDDPAMVANLVDINNAISQNQNISSLKGKVVTDAESIINLNKSLKNEIVSLKTDLRNVKKSENKN